MPTTEKVLTVPYAEFLSFGDYADLYWEDTTTLSIRWEEGKVERFSGGRESGAGLRFLVGEETRYGYADDLGAEALRKLYRDLTGGPSNGTKKGPPKGINW